MFNNYYKIAWRHILKEKFYSLINILGLGVGLACCIYIAFYINDQLSYDQYHENLDRTYRILQGHKDGEGIATPPSPEEFRVWGNAPIGPALKEEFAEVETFCRFTPAYDKLIEVNDHLYNEEGIVFGDSSAFEVFSWPLLSGNPETALTEPNTIVLSESLAKKYFPDGDALGKSIIYDQNRECIVTGVMKDIPKNSHFTFDGILSMSTFYQQRPTIFEDWGYVDFYTYVLLKENSTIASIKPRINELAAKHTSDWDGYKFYADVEPLDGAYLNSVAARQPGKTGSLSSLIIFSMIGGFILLIACMNFINLSTARSLERAKEIGVRKVVGARQSSLIFQFLSEFSLLALFAGIVALALISLTSPYFESITGLSIVLSDLLTIEFIGAFISLLVILGLLSGSYPAFLLSKYEPAKVLKGNFKTGSKGVSLRKGLVTFQFILTLALIIGTITIYNQLSYLQNHELGFDKEQTLVMEFGFDIQAILNIETIKDEFLKDPDVTAIAASRAVPGKFHPNAGTQIEGPDGTLIPHNPAIYEVDPDFIPLYNIEVVAGRPFSYNFTTDSTEALIVNKAAASLWGYENPEDIIGKRFDQWGKQGVVIGVVDNFNYRSLHSEVEPLTIRYEPFSMAMFSLKLDADNIQSTIMRLEDKWRELIPQRPLVYYFLDDNFDKHYRADRQFAQLFTAFAILAILIAFLGLFGLTTYSTAQRVKEIGIRKVLGASFLSILMLLSKDIAKVILMAFVVAIPLSWFAMQSWIESYAYRAPMSINTYFIAVLSISATALAIVGWHSVRVVILNPVNSLRSE
ncbi:ABC transporter permease [Fulvivirga sp. RKSG066]|nr:ABC transporter permease [Fulvivirga aurantia]